jgi:tricorn protease
MTGAFRCQVIVARVRADYGGWVPAEFALLRPQGHALRRGERLVRTPCLVAVSPFLIAASMALAAPAAAGPIRLATSPALSPDGSTLAFSWAGDIWSVPVAGGVARPLTRHPGRDREPSFSPDGRSIAFVSDREGSDQVFVMTAEGGSPRQITHHTAGYTLEGWFPDGQSLLVSGSRDHHWRDARRFFRVALDRRSAEELLFDDHGDEADLSADGKTLIFNREGAPWWRKGYHGSQASQVWRFDLETKSFAQLLAPEAGARWPLWRPDGKGFYYVGLHNGALNLRERELESGRDRPLTEFNDDSVVFPSLARDGTTIVFRHLFDFYRIHPSRGGSPERIAITCDGDDALGHEPIARRTLTQARQVAFSRDGLEIAFIAGGDLWVMDTVLMEPRAVTTTHEEERDPVFAPEGDALLFVSDRDGQSDIWRAQRSDPASYWWQNTEFKLDRLTQDAEVEGSLQWSPDGGHVGFVKGRGDLWVMNPDGKDARRLLASWNPPAYDWSPDGAWIVYAHADPDFNEDIWIIPIDGSRPPFNLSRHPDNEFAPAWSPDGKIIAFTGRRIEDEVDIYYIWLRAEDDETTRRERTMEKAVEKIKQARKKGARPARDPDNDQARGEPARRGEGDASASAAAKDDETRPEGPAKPKGPPRVVIDFEDIHDRLHHVSIPNATETGLFWSPDSKKLAFSTTIEGKSGVYTIEILDDLKPKLLSGQSVRQSRWIESGNQVVGLMEGVPASLAASGKETLYRFRALQTVSFPERLRAAFDLCWRTMRDRYYDERLGNRNWDAIRRKYIDVAAQSPDLDTFAIAVDLMLGELNGSHLGFSPQREGSGTGPGPGPGPRRGPGGASGTGDGPGRWNVVTAHLGVRFEEGYKGPGLKVRDVIPEGPADRRKSRIAAGEVILAIDGVNVDPSMDLTDLLNGRLDRDIRLTIQEKATEGQTGGRREVTLRPIAYGEAQSLLYDKWVDENRKKVEQASQGTLGYLHIRGMNTESFHKFEEELYSAGSGKVGLIIDVRHNGGGSTTDHLLTVLSQPVHAITVPRGGEPGYPQDRRVYATWSKPILVLCNQNSFSNAEIFAHAIKTLKRGKLVGVPTAGGVISTGAAVILDVGLLRLPTRGWFVLGTGEDMELNGAVPDHIVWPQPGDFARGVDAQLEKAVSVLLDDVKEKKERPQPRLRKASER